jgi:Ca-activated chloride channel family protein
VLVTLGRHLAATVALAGSCLAATGAQQAPVYRSETRTVPVYVTVLGPDGHLVTDLQRDDFELLDNGRAQPITLFDAGLQPITIVVMLDMSGSMTGNISLLRNAAVQMFTRLLPADKARVGNFGDRIVISPTFTNDVDTLIRALWLDLQPGGPTPLWGAVNAAMGAMARMDGRRVVLVLSDGKNTGLRSINGIAAGPSLEDVVRRAQTEDFMVYAIGLQSRMSPAPRPQATPARRGSSGARQRFGSGLGLASNEPDPGLRELAAQSGGGYFEIRERTDLAETFARVADELHRQYLLGFVAPESDGRIHEIEVRVKNGSLVPRARQSYQAPGRR